MSATVAQKALNDRVDDIAEILSEDGHSRRSRTEIIRALVFALPIDSPDQVERIIHLGAMRLYNEVAGFENDGHIADLEHLLGWYSSDRSRTELIDELARVRRELSHMRWHLDTAREKLSELIDREAGGDST